MYKKDRNGDVLMKKRVVVIILMIVALCLGTGEIASAAISVGFKAYLCGIIDSDGADRTSWIMPSKNALLQIKDATVVGDTAFNSTELASHIKNANFFVIHTHGNYKSLKTVDGSNVSKLNSSDIAGWSSSSLFNLKVAFLGACKTGSKEDDNLNLVDAMFSRGARCVIGYTETVNTACNKTMLQNFCVAIGNGYTIQNALAYADAQVLATKGKTGNTNLRYVRGDTSAKFREASLLLRHIGESVNEEIVYFTDEDGIYGYFDASKINQVNRTTTMRAASYGIAQEDVVKSFAMTKVSNFDKYALSYQKYVEDTGITTYVYAYYIDNIITDDYFFVMVNNNNQVVSYGLPNEGEFDSLDLEKVSLDEADEYIELELRNNGIEEYKIVDKCIVKENGVFSIRYSIKYSLNSSEYEYWDEFIVPLGGF